MIAPRLSLAAEPRFFRGASVQSRLLDLGLRTTVRPFIAAWAQLPIDWFPPNLIDLAAKLLPSPDGAHWRTVRLADCDAEWVRGPGVDQTRADDPGTGVILYFHGGAFFTCGLNTHRRLVSYISAAAHQPVLNVGYRQMPHEPITESIADGVAGFAWLLDQGYRADQITIAGDSAGGYLSFSVARAVMDAGWGSPAGVVALSPLLEFDAARKREHANARRDAVFPLSALERFSEVTARLDHRRGVVDRRTCPVDMPLADMPPTLLQVGSREILMADVEVMANRLVSAGVPCDLQVWDRQVHVFQAAASWVPESRAAIEEIGTFVRHLAATSSAPAAASASDTA